MGNYELDFSSDSYCDNLKEINFPGRDTPTSRNWPSIRYFKPIEAFSFVKLSKEVVLFFASERFIDIVKQSVLKYLFSLQRY